MGRKECILAAQIRLLGDDRQRLLHEVVQVGIDRGDQRAAIRGLLGGDAAVWDADDVEEDVACHGVDAEPVDAAAGPGALFQHAVVLAGVAAVARLVGLALLETHELPDKHNIN